jgi:outer membrane protein assembly factor BamB
MSPWPIFGHDAQHTGQSPFNGPKTANLRWSFEFKESSGGNPVIGRGGSPVTDGDGTIYVTSNYASTGILYAINPDGTLKWKGNSDVTGATSPAIGLDGTIYVARDLWRSWNNLWAFNKLSGNNIWSYPIAAQSKGPVISPEGVLHICDETALYAINSDGSLKWKNDLAYGCLTPALAHDGSIIVINNAHGDYSTLISFDKETGQTNWSLDTDAPAGGIFPVIHSDGTIYVLGANPYFKNIYSVSLSGLFNWKKELPDSPLCHSIAQDGTIYLGSSDSQGAGALYALFPTGDLKWIYVTGVVIGPPAIGADGIIYFGTGRYPETNLGDSKIVALRPDGSLLWEYLLPPVQGEETFYPIIGADGTLYVSWYGFLYAFKD